ncbi:transcriptional repressor [Coemansia brasiliensis]|uniref:Transcriptional repressor n=1 Tax=Coemansia brasiliensis TaxID=2650707 RepID=A0A9W8LVU7_9FUNG|nr:transcriptional repressor [Coemansia brasiliensis]
MSSSPVSSSSVTPSPADRARRPSHLGLWSPVSLSSCALSEKQPRSLSIRTAGGQCVSILNDDTPGSSDSGSEDAHSDNGLQLSLPSPSNALHCIRRTHSSIGMNMPTPQHTPTRLPSLSALVEAATMVSSSRSSSRSSSNEMPQLPPPCTQAYSPTHCLHLHHPQQHVASAPAYSRTASRTQNKRKYHCTYPGCGKAFTTSGHLSRHFRIHTGEKNYHCLYPGCTSRFSRQDNMMQHYRTHLSPRSRRNRSLRSVSGYPVALSGHSAVLPSATASSAFSPYKRPFAQHSPLAPPQWSFF